MAVQLTEKTLTVADWSIIGIYFAICLGLGVYVSIIVYMAYHFDLSSDTYLTTNRFFCWQTWNLESTRFTCLI